MSKKKIGIFVGSLRRDSYSKIVANYVKGKAPEGFEFSIIDISNLPIYNQDFDDDGTPPAEYNDFRAKLKPLDGFIFVTPEYNRSVPAVLKNALDVGSRPYGQNSWDGKPGGIISVSIGNISGFGANHHLRQSMTFLNVLMLQQPEAYLGHITDSLDSNNNIVKGTADFLDSFVKAYLEWVNKIVK